MTGVQTCALPISEESLKMFISGVAQMKAGKDEGVRRQIDTAMQIADRKSVV